MNNKRNRVNRVIILFNMNIHTLLSDKSRGGLLVGSVHENCDLKAYVESTNLI